MPQNYVISNTPDQILDLVQKTQTYQLSCVTPMSSAALYRSGLGKPRSYSAGCELGCSRMIRRSWALM